MKNLFDITDRSYVLGEQSIIAEGTSRELLKSQKLLSTISVPIQLILLNETETFDLYINSKIPPFKKIITVDSDKSQSIRSFIIGSIVRTNHSKKYFRVR